MKKLLLPSLIVGLAISSTHATHSLKGQLETSREIVEIKEKIAEHRMSQSTLATVGHVAATTTFGFLMGALTGIVHSGISHSTLDSFIGATPDFPAAHLARILANAVQGTIAGFGLGIAGKAGTLPQMSNAELALMLTIHSAITLALDCAADYVGAQIGDQMIERAMQDLGVPQEIIVRAGGPRRLFRRGIAEALENARHHTIVAIIGATMAAQAAALLALIPEIISIRSQRNDAGKKHQALEKTLKDLQQLLQEYDDNAANAAAEATA